MKIKTKRQLNFSQLITWAWSNPKQVESKIYRVDTRDAYSNFVHFSVDGYGFEIYGFISINDTFTVEVEEEITEDTVLKKAIEVYSDKYDNFLATSCEGKSVKDILDSNVGNDTKTEKIYLFNDDDTMTLIWRDGKLVE